MDPKSTLDIKKKLNVLALNHNRLTTLCAHLLNEVNGLKKEIAFMKENGHSDNNVKVINTSNNNSSSNYSKSSHSTNFSELKADEILKQLSMNNIDN